MAQHPLESLNRYDAKAIAAYYRWRPWKALSRTIGIGSAFLGFVLGLWWDGRQSPVQKPGTQEPTAQELNSRAQRLAQRANHLRRILIRLGPTYIKVGQALSTRPDLVSKDFLAELEKLQDQLPAFSNAKAFALIEAHLGRPIHQVYQEISPDPVAAASLGQVYKAQLLTGEPVAVKVQRPNLLPVLTLDLYLMRWGAKLLGPFLPLNLGHDLQEIVDEFGIKLFEEIDYLNEGRNAERFATNFQGDPTVKVPQIYWRFSSNRVLTLEWIPGCKLTNTEYVCNLGLNPDDLVLIGVTTGLQQLLEHGFFHADPHPGNLFALARPTPQGPQAQMAYIDFGMMDQIDETAKETLVDAVVHLINKDYEELAQDFVKLGFLTPETDIRPIVPALESVLGDLMGESVKDFNFKTVTDRFSELMYDYPFRLPAKFALIIRSLVTQEGLALTLNPNFKILEVAYPYVARRLLQGESPALRRRLLEVLFKDGKFQWERLENMIGIARTGGSFDLLPSARMGFQFLMSEEGKYLRNQLVLALTENDRLHTAEMQRLWHLIQPELQPSRIFTEALNAIAGFSSATNFLPTPPWSKKSA